MSIDRKILSEIERYRSINKYILEQAAEPAPDDLAALAPDAGAAPPPPPAEAGAVPPPPPGDAAAEPAADAAPTPISEGATAPPSRFKPWQDEQPLRNICFPSAI